ncbi:MAG: tyrosine-type recombinase/integrase, partial [Candidatus Obscuribacterales bacterium]|nr:tyrosine-type recombinase/integrase [Candidatus Obscuribacterales bacterium]
MAQVLQLVKQDTTSSLDEYEQKLGQKPLSVHTKRAYRTRVKAFSAYLSTCNEPLDLAVMQYKGDLLAGGTKPSTVNVALAAIDDCMQTLGLGKHGIKKADIQSSRPKALTPDETRKLLHKLNSESKRDRVIVMLMLEAGLRISEVSALKVADVPASSRKGIVIVRCGKGQKTREISMNSRLREAVLD